VANNRLRTCIEIRQYLKGASYRVAWNTCLVCVVYGGRDFDPISSSCQPCMNGWTCDPIWRRIGTTSSAPISGPQHFFCWERIVFCGHCYSRARFPLLVYLSQTIIFRVGHEKRLHWYGMYSRQHRAQTRRAQGNLANWKLYTGQTQLRLYDLDPWKVLKSD
jgi:hypothetical protein